MVSNKESKEISLDILFMKLVKNIFIIIFY